MLMSRSFRSLVGGFLVFVSSIGICEDAKTAIPKQVGGLPYKTAKKYEEAELGVSLSYQGEGATLTIFLYRGGIPLIPDGVDSDVFTSQFGQAKNDILTAKTWTTVCLVSEGTVLIGRKADIKARRALYDVSVGDTQYSTILYLTAGRNRFYKARLTAPTASPVLEDERIASLQRNLGDLIESWIAR